MTELANSTQDGDSPSPEPESKGLAQFVVVLRGPAAIRIREAEALGPIDFPTPVGQVKVLFGTFFNDEGFTSRIPRGLWAEVRGGGNELMEVLEPFGGAANYLAAFLAFSANCSAGQLNIEIGFENTPGSTDRPYFQQFLPQERGFFGAGRWLDVDAALDFIRAVASSADSERLGRAVDHYREALGHWLLGREIMALTHLWIASEVVAPLVRRQELERLEATEVELAEKWGVVDAGTANLDADQKRVLESELRLRLIFQSDLDCYQDARSARVGFVHGFENLGQLRATAVRVRDATAHYVRESILRAAATPDDVRECLMSAPFDQPLCYDKPTLYFKSRLLGEGTLHAEGQLYPYFEWRSGLKQVELKDDDAYAVTPNETLTARLGDLITADKIRFEVWGPRSKRAVAPEREAEAEGPLNAE